MRVLVIGATGTIGRAVVAALKGNEVVEASHHKAREKVDITNPQSIRDLYKRVGRVDAAVCVEGGGAWKPLAALTDEDFAASLADKLMGQVNVIRFGFESVRDGGLPADVVARSYVESVTGSRTGAVIAPAAR